MIVLCRFCTERKVKRSKWHADSWTCGDAECRRLRDNDRQRKSIQNKETPKKERKCDQCGKQFVFDITHKRKYCSKDCSLTAVHSLNAERRAKKKPKEEKPKFLIITRDCAECGKPFSFYHPTNRRYCSRRCFLILTNRKQAKKVAEKRAKLHNLPFL